MELAGVRYAVVVQPDLLSLSTWLVAPTSTSAREATSRSEASIEGRPTRVPAERTSAVDPQRSRESPGHLSFDEPRESTPRCAWSSACDSGVHDSGARRLIA